MDFRSGSFLPFVTPSGWAGKAERQGRRSGIPLSPSDETTRKHSPGLPGAAWLLSLSDSVFAFMDCSLLGSLSHGNSPEQEYWVVDTSSRGVPLPPKDGNPDLLEELRVDLYHLSYRESPEAQERWRPKEKTGRWAYL